MCNYTTFKIDINYIGFDGLVITHRVGWGNTGHGAISGIVYNLLIFDQHPLNRPETYGIYSQAKMNRIVS